MVAGRSGSAYTAELGSMKMREEIDALQTMGFDPISVLVLPRILALVIAVPMLTFLGEMSALYGAGLVASFYGGIQPEVFIQRLREVISIDHFMVGMVKAPFMAMVIGIVACVRGLETKGSAESLGMQTTNAVVSIFRDRAGRRSRYSSRRSTNKRTRCLTDSGFNLRSSRMKRRSSTFRKHAARAPAGQFWRQKVLGVNFDVNAAKFCLSASGAGKSVLLRPTASFSQRRNHRSVRQNSPRPRNFASS
jgi:hypothetical protein